MLKEKFVFDLQRFVEIYNDKSYTLLSGTSGKDNIYNGGYWDSGLHKGGSKVTIHAASGDDNIDNNGENVTIDAGTGNDYIYNGNDNVSIYGGSGKDSIHNGSNYNVTIIGGKGDDYIDNYGENMTIDAGKGNDSIINQYGSNNVKIYGGTGNDYISNGYEEIGGGSNLLINGGEGNDSIFNDENTKNVTISGGSGNDSIKNWGSNVTIDGDSGNDYIISEDTNVSINGGSGNDFIDAWGDKLTINGGAGDDSIFNDWNFNENAPWTNDYGSNVLFKYNSGDGKDIIYGFRVDSTLSISGGEYSTTKSGNNIIVTVGTGRITLAGAASLSAVNIDGKEKDYWLLSGTTATYGTTNKTLATVKGVKSRNGLAVDGKTIIVSKASLNKKKVTVSGGYFLALDSDVSDPTTKKAAWTLKNSTAIYKSSYQTAGYTLANNAKSITYSKATTPTKLATIKGVTSLDNLKVSGKTIKLSAGDLSKNVTVSGDYNFYFNADYKDATITGSSGNDTITTRGKKISVKGGKGDDTIKILGSGTVAGGAGADVFVFKSSGANVITDYAEEDKISIASGTAKISSSGNNVIFSVGKEKITVKNAKDKSITYIDNGGEKIYKASDDKIIFNDAGTGATLTAKYTADEFTPNDYSDYVDTLVTIDAAQVTNPLTITGNKKSNQIIGTNEDDLIDGGAGADKIYGADGNDTLIGGVGNDKLYGDAGDDSLWGGAGSDTLFGGDGDDIFFYKNGDGNDVIADFTDMDKIIVNAADIGNPTTNNGDVTFSIGLGKIVIKNGADKIIQLYDESGGELTRRYTPGRA